jgi:hypothetical protein
MYYYIYINSVNLIEKALNILNIKYITKKQLPYEFNDNQWSTHKFNKNYEKQIIEYFSKINMKINFSGHSVWIQEIENNSRSNCIDCNIEINTYNTSYIKKCKKCYFKNKSINK